MAFLHVQTQWRYAPSGQRLGLDYSAVRVALEALGMRMKQVFSGLQVMEFAVLESIFGKSTDN